LSLKFVSKFKLKHKDVAAASFGLVTKITIF